MPPVHPESEPLPAAELIRVRRLLERMCLPSEDLSAASVQFWVERRGEEIVGCIGLERIGELGFLRSLAVEPSSQSHGAGRRLVEALLRAATEAKIRELWLLTTSARDYFAKWGFAVVARREVASAIQAHPQFTGHCPSSAHCMRLSLVTR